MVCVCVCLCVCVLLRTACSRIGCQWDATFLPCLQGFIQAHLRDHHTAQAGCAETCGGGRRHCSAVCHEEGCCPCLGATKPFEGQQTAKNFAFSARSMFVDKQRLLSETALTNCFWCWWNIVFHVRLERNYYVCFRCPWGPKFIVFKTSFKMRAHLGATFGVFCPLFAWMLARCQHIPGRFWGGVLFNLLNPTGHVLYQQFNIQQLYLLPTLYLCVLYLSENKERLVPLTA